MLQLVSSVELTSSTTAWHICFTPSSIGWMFLSASSLSTEWPFVGVCGAMLFSTSSTATCLQPMLSVASGSAQQVAISSSCHDIVAPISVVGRLLLQAWRPGTRCQTLCVIRRLAKKDTFRRLLKTYCLHFISARSALEALRNALYKFSIYLLTYLPMLLDCCLSVLSVCVYDVGNGILWPNVWMN